MFEVDLSQGVPVIIFIAVWLITYYVLLMARFGTNISFKTEAIALTVSVIPSVLMFTDLIVFKN